MNGEQLRMASLLLVLVILGYLSGMGLESERDLG